MPSAEKVVQRASNGLRTLLEDHGIDESHGHAHALQVLDHTDRALQAANPALPTARALSVRLAALLHDADDRKFFPETAASYGNASALMADAGAHDFGEEVIPAALRMISLVSCSGNGNSVPPEAAHAPEMLWPRWADRLEATGEIGVVRCFQYNISIGAPLALESTPRPTSPAGVWALATPERFSQYQASGGGSASMIDHYYDKLLQVARPPSEAVRNR